MRRDITGFIVWSLIVAFYIGVIIFIVRGKGRLLRLAAFFALFGAFPGFIISIVHDIATTPTVNGSANIHWWNFFTLPIPYFLFVVPGFGSYCFAAGLAGGFIIRLTQESPRKWLEPLAIIILPMMAAIPMALLGWPLEAFGSSVFWVLIMLLFKRTLFGEAALERSSRFHTIYRWATEHR